MARYTGASCKLCRREGQKLFLKGERCYGGKCALSRRAYAPGQHGQARKKLSEYGVQLLEKQRLRNYYGVLEKQFVRYVDKAMKSREQTGPMLLNLLEKRLDNMVYRMGFASSIRQARQMVNHGHFLVNEKKIDIPSYGLTIGDVIELREKSRKTEMFVENFKATLVREPQREELPIEINEQLIVEYYSK